MGETVLLIGLQWGDEGKGKVIDALSARFDLVIRFQGGANAGHTIHIGEEEFVLRLVPSGILRPQTLCIIGNGVVVDPVALVAEIAGLRQRGVQVGENLVISDRAHVVMPYHKALDEAVEKARGDARLGTTKNGIGPCYADRASRCGIRFAEMMEPDVFRARLLAQMELKNRVLQRVYGAEPLDAEAVYKEFCGYAEELKPHVQDTVPLIHQALKDDRAILLEGAQGSMLDLNFGTYPFVTSSEVIGGATVGTGIPSARIDRTIGVVKAYCSRVGTGPFPTEQSNEVGETIRRTIETHGGREYGSVTGRPRRCGWLDGVALRYTAELNGVTGLAVGVLDVLSAFEKLKICTRYRLDGRELRSFPASSEALEAVEPVYEELDGWQTDISDVTGWEELPPQARQYLQAIESLAGAPVEFVSVGPRRGQVIER